VVGRREGHLRAETVLAELRDLYVYAAKKAVFNAQSHRPEAQGRCCFAIFWRYRFFCIYFFRKVFNFILPISRTLPF